MTRELVLILPLICGAGTALAAALPITFEENRGQVPSSTEFYARTPGYQLFLKRREAVIALQDGHAVRIHLAHSKETTPLGIHRLVAKSNYLLGSDSTRWRTGIANYEGVTYPQVYPGIDLAWHTRGDEIEQDFQILAGANPRQIGLRFTGATLRLTPEGDLMAGSLRFDKPRAYQNDREVQCRYELHGATVRFVLGPYDHARPLTIDPVLSFSTYLGGGGDTSLITALDSMANVYVVGLTTSNFPTTAGAFQPKPSGAQCGVIYEPFGPPVPNPCPEMYAAKFSPDGKTLQYATYLGEAPGDNPIAIAVGPTGNLYLIGSGPFPNLSPLPGQTIDPKLTFLAALSADGSALLFATALPAAALRLAVDANNAVYLTGSTTGGLPTVNAFQSSLAGTSNAFVMKLDATGSTVLYSTYLGGSRVDEGLGIAVDALGRAYVAGATLSPDFPVAAAIQPALGGSGSAFVTVLDSGGSHLVWSTYFGGNNAAGSAGASSIALDPAGNVHVSGGAWPHANAFTAKIRGDGSAVIYSVGLGGPFVAADAAGNTYIAGYTASPALPTVNAIQNTLAGSNDVYVAELNGQTGVLLYATYLGGGGNEYTTGMAADAAGDVYVVGQTSSSNFPLKSPFQTNVAGGFVAKLGATMGIGGMTNAASYSTTVSPGELVSIFGTALASSVAVATHLPLPTRLSDAQITVNGVAAPLVYASPQQVNSQIPFETQIGTAQVGVSSGYGAGTLTVQVAAVAPAIFSLDETGTGPGAILHAATNQLVTDANPAAAGETISIYCTGLGAVNPPAQTGAAPSDSLSQTVVPVQVSIGGTTVQPTYAGVAPGLAGLYQVNATIPAGTPSGAQPLQIIQNSTASNTVTVRVQ